MNKLLVGLGTIGVLLVIIGHFSPWVWYAETLGETSLSAKQLPQGIFLFDVPVLMWGLLAMFCVFVAATRPPEKEFTTTIPKMTIVSKIMGAFVAMCGVLVLIGLAEVFSDLQALASLVGSPTPLHYDYGAILSAFGGGFVLLAGLFGIFD